MQYDPMSSFPPETPEEQLPSTMVRNVKDPLGEDAQAISEGLDRIRSRFDETLKFIYEVASSNLCRCSYMKDPGCLACRARHMLTSLEAQDAPESTQEPVAILPPHV